MINMPYEQLACNLRKKILHTIYLSKASHIASNLSIVEILTVLYGRILKYDQKNPTWEERDRLILSKGHAAVVLYSILSEAGFFPDTWLDSYSSKESILLGHISHHVPGVELSTGSLGHGLPVGVGIAMSLKHDKSNSKVYVIISDGELDEGSNWEAFMFSGHHKLDNLIVILDYNKIQSYGSVNEIIALEPLRKKMESFQWSVEEVDGHNCNELEKILSNTPFKQNKPSIVIANTIKGKGISFMENNLLWHYKNPDGEEYKKALKELESK
jgi:transketolase